MMMTQVQIELEYAIEDEIGGANSECSHGG